jgi:uridine kinase
LQVEASKKPLLIGIAGPSCAGKTELARRLAAELKAPVLALDSYYKDLAHLPFEQRARMNFDVPEALDEELVTEHVRRLAEGLEIAAPVYDFARHTRSEQVAWVRAERLAILEGLFTLYWPAVRERLGVKVYVGAPEEVCLARRLERDIRERGRTEESVRAQFRTTVAPMARRYIVPTAAYADLVLSGTDPIERSVAEVLRLIRERS